jgi:hypothetical protein
MDKSTLSNYGWVVIVTLVLAVMLALATPFGDYVGKGASEVLKSYTQAGNNAVNPDNISVQSQKWDDYLNDENQGDDNGDDEDIMIDGPIYPELTGTGYLKAKKGTTGYVKFQNGHEVYGVVPGTNPLDYFEPINPAHYLGMEQGTAQAGVLNGTGSEIVIYEDSAKTKKLHSFPLIIFGDVNGDGKITLTDASDMKSHISGLKTLNYTQKKAGDLSLDNVIGLNDVNAIYNHVAGYTTIATDITMTSQLFEKEGSTGYIHCGQFLTGFPEGSNPLDYFVATNHGNLNIRQGYAKDGVTNGTGNYIELYDPLSNKLIGNYYLILFGDVNGDGLVSLEDAIAAQKHVEGTEIITNECFYQAGDVNADGVIDSADCSAILKHAGGTQLLPLNPWIV